MIKTKRRNTWKYTEKHNLLKKKNTKTKNKGTTRE